MAGRRLAVRWLLALIVLLVACFSAPARAADVYVSVRVSGVINPVKARLVKRALARAEAEQARFLIVGIDTPGGLVSSMQEIVAALSNARVPVVTFASPRSAQATSAGAFILLAGELAAMSPGARVGAAHPVAAGKALEGPLDDKVTNSLSSLMRSLSERRSRPPEPAEEMVRKSTNYTAEQAFEKKLIELLSPNEQDLLRQLDGREFAGGKRLRTAGLAKIEVRLSKYEQLLDYLADPTLTSLLLSLGMLALLYELSSPGIGAGGALGALMLVLGLLGSSVLPIEVSAVVLLAIGFAAIALEVKLPTHGVLGGAGLLAVVLGGLMIIDPGDYLGGVRRVNAGLFVPLVLGAAVALLLLTRAARAAFSAPQLTGLHTLVGRTGTARSTFGARSANTEGVVFVDGARWTAHTEDAELHAGDAITVLQVHEKPTRLFVRRS